MGMVKQETFRSVVYKISIGLISVAIIALLGWIISQSDRVSALEVRQESGDITLSKSLDNLEKNQQEIKQDVRDIHNFLFGSMKPEPTPKKEN